jgi:hypothetical protein
MACNSPGAEAEDKGICVIAGRSANEGLRPKQQPERRAEYLVEFMAFGIAKVVDRRKGFLAGAAEKRRVRAATSGIHCRRVAGSP